MLAGISTADLESTTRSKSRTPCTRARPSMVIGVLLAGELAVNWWILPTCFGSAGLRVRARKQPRLFP